MHSTAWGLVQTFATDSLPTWNASPQKNQGPWFSQSLDGNLKNISMMILPIIGSISFKKKNWNMAPSTIYWSRCTVWPCDPAVIGWVGKLHVKLTCRNWNYTKTLSHKAVQSSHQKNPVGLSKVSPSWKTTLGVWCCLVQALQETVTKRRLPALSLPKSCPGFKTQCKALGLVCGGLKVNGSSDGATMLLLVCYRQGRLSSQSTPSLPWPMPTQEPSAPSWCFQIDPATWERQPSALPLFHHVLIGKQMVPCFVVLCGD